MGFLYVNGSLLDSSAFLNAACCVIQALASSLCNITKTIIEALAHIAYYTIAHFLT